MNITFNVLNQYLTRTDSSLVVADSKNYLNAVFTFSSDWAGLTKKVRFVHRLYDIPYVMTLTDNACLVPYQVLKNGEFTVSVFAGDINTANIVCVPVSPCGWSEVTAPENGPLN
jgi:hypothetical protein